MLMYSLLLAQAANPGTDAGGIWQDLLQSLDVWKLVGVVVTAVIVWGFKVLRDRVVKDEELAEGLQALETGVLHMSDKYVEFKKTNEGKALSDEQKQFLRDEAIKVAKEVATGPGKNWLLRVGEKALRKYIDKLWGKNKELVKPSQPAKE